MEKIGGMYVVGANNEQMNLMKGREAFLKKYCADRGWNMSNLDIMQVLEIRKQDGWKTPWPNE